MHHMRHSGWLCCAAVLSFATALQLPARRGSDSLPWPCDVPATSAALPAHRQHRQLTFPIRRTHLNSPLIIGQIERRTVDQLIAYSKNARTHSAAQIDQIAASIMEFGFTNPILVGPDNVIIAGHARHRAARQLGLPEVTVIVLAHLSEAQRHALAIADNQLALNASWDEELLRAELAALAEENIDLTLLGFDDGALAHLLEQDAAQDLEDGGAVHDKVADADRKRRFLQEARAASALNHPNIVTMYDIASDGGVDYLVMEYVPGKSLDKLIAPKGLPPADALDLGRADRRRAGGSACGRHRASGYQTGERDRRGRVSGENPGFRSGQADGTHPGGRRNRYAADRTERSRYGTRHGSVHVAGTGERRGSSTIARTFSR